MPLYPKVLQTKEHAPIPSPCAITFKLTLESIKKLGGVSQCVLPSHLF
jgi:hypothetical protein